MWCRWLRVAHYPNICYDWHIHWSTDWSRPRIHNCCQRQVNNPAPQPHVCRYWEFYSLNFCWPFSTVCIIIKKTTYPKWMYVLVNADWSYSIRCATTDNSLPVTLLNINLTHSLHSRIAFGTGDALMRDLRAQISGIKKINPTRKARHRRNSYTFQASTQTDRVAAKHVGCRNKKHYLPHRCLNTRHVGRLL